MKLFFIVGSGRCGTQMLRNILSSYDDITILPETHFIIPLYEKYKLNDITCDNFLEVIDSVYSGVGKKWVKVILSSAKKDYINYKKNFKRFIKLNNIKGSIKDFTEAFYIFLYGHKYLVGDKTPHYGANLQIILKIWPDAKIINLKRDGINVALSMLKHPAFIRDINGKIAFKNIGRIKIENKEKNFSSNPPSIEEALKFWKDSINQIDESIIKSKKKNRFKLLNLHYEDFIYDTRKASKQLIDFLDLKNDRLLYYKTLCQIKPFSPLKNPLNLNKDQYLKLYKLVQIEMKINNYPYIIQNKHGIFFEFLRIIGHYIFYTIDVIKKIYSKIFI
jgi:hypothetical protein